MKFDAKEDSKRILVVCFAAVIMAINIKSFVRTGGLFPGGATGLSLLIQRSVQMFWDIELPYSLINILLNLIPIYIGFKYIGKKFTLYSCLMILLSSALTDVIPENVITYDMLLISVFGGIINGFVVSLCLVMNATTGGTDFIAIFLSERKNIDSFNIILCVNVVILTIAGFLFGWEKALYSMIYQYVSTQIMHMLYKRYQQNTLFIVTNHPKKIADVIYECCNHGATIIDGEGSYEQNERMIVYSVVSSAESKKVVAVIKEADPQAFVNVIRTEQISGRFYQKPNE